MSIKQKMLMLVASVGLLLALSVMGVAAAPNSLGAIPNDIPGTALYVDGVSHPIAGNSSLWYKFNTTSNSRDEAVLTLLTLTNGTNSGLKFDVYSDSQIANWWDATPIGRGTSQSNNGVRSDNLTWAGEYDGNGVQYIRVTNTNPGAAAFTLLQSQVGSRR
jgi:hypothetical protein